MTYSCVLEICSSGKKLCINVPRSQSRTSALHAWTCRRCCGMCKARWQSGKAVAGFNIPHQCHTHVGAVLSVVAKQPLNTSIHIDRRPAKTDKTAAAWEAHIPGMRSTQKDELLSSSYDTVNTQTAD